MQRNHLSQQGQKNSKHRIMSKERRRLTFKPTGQEAEGVPENAELTEVPGEWTIKRVVTLSRVREDALAMGIGVVEIEIEEKDNVLLEKVELSDRCRRLETI